jgi:hypothetical protein
MKIFETFLDEGKPVLIAIRDIIPDSSNPLNAEQVKDLWENVYQHNKLVKVIIIPDIASVNYGRGVGYEVNQIEVPDAIAGISATEIRQQIREGKHEWKEMVDPSIHEKLAAYFAKK